MGGKHFAGLGEVMNTGSRDGDRMDHAGVIVHGVDSVDRSRVNKNPHPARLGRGPHHETNPSSS